MARPSRRRFLRASLGLAGLGLVSGCGMLPFTAPSTAKVHRIGYVRAETPPAGDLEGFREGLREHGYVDGTNVVVEYRFADGDLDLLRSQVAELVSLPVDLIVASAPDATRIAREATTTIPIVMVLVADPVAFDFVASLAHPGGNITGFAFLLPELSGKRLDLLKQTVPGLSRVAVVWNATNRYKPVDLREVQIVADALGVEVQPFPVSEPAEFDAAFDAAAKGGAEGLITLEDPFTIAHRQRIVDLARRHRLPALYAVRPFVDAGGLMVYGPDRIDQNRRAAVYVDKLLKGAKPADLPVERPTKFEWIINLKAAQDLGLAIPESVLQQATEIIQ